MQTVVNYSTAGLLVGEWSFTLKIIISNLIFKVEKEKLTIFNTAFFEAFVHLKYFSA